MNNFWTAWNSSQHKVHLMTLLLASKLVNNTSRTESSETSVKSHILTLSKQNPSDRRILSYLQRLSRDQNFDQFWCKRYQKKRYKMNFQVSTRLSPKIFCQAVKYIHSLNTYEPLWIFYFERIYRFDCKILISNINPANISVKFLWYTNPRAKKWWVRV